MTRFEGKVALVTGAGSGIGRATCIRLAGEGSAVACLDVVEEAADKTAAEVADFGGKAVSVRCDVSDEASVREAVAGTLAGLGTVDVLCNIAGIGRFGHTPELSLEEWERTLAVNLTGTFLMCRELLPHLAEVGGNIVNAASTAGLMGQPYSAAYCASKGGVVLLTKSLAVEYLDRGVRVNAVAPGGIVTPLIEQFRPPEGANPELMARIMTPMGMAEPAEVAGLVAYLASDEARYVTGAIMSFDGGLTT